MNTTFALGSLVVILAASAAAQDYAIKISQPLKVGQRYKMTAVASSTMEGSTTSGTQVVKRDKNELSVEFESEVTVLAIDAKGRPTKESHTIVKLLEGAGKESIVPAGTKVVASRPNQKMLFEIDGKSLTNAVAKALAEVVGITIGGPTDDEVFGTKERKKVGDQWPINEVLALQGVTEKLKGLNLSATNIKGTTTLHKVTKDSGGDVIHLLANMSTTMSPKVKPQSTHVTATMNLTLTGAFPADINKGVRVEGMTMTLILNTFGKQSPEGPLMQISNKAKTSTTHQYKLLD